jgi:AraC-like DNA-binding protein/quercetin dioxygenase-like cupin family protein
MIISLTNNRCHANIRRNTANEITTQMPQFEARSTTAKDFQQLPQKIAVMVKTFNNGHKIEKHSHDRDQLLYATNGLMQLYTNSEIWAVPSDRAIYIPAGTVHWVKMYGAVTMRTLYIDSNGFKFDSSRLRVILVTALMRELITALGEESIDYQPVGREAMIAQLIAVELERARSESLNIPLPLDPRLQSLCARLIANPADRQTLNDWGHVCGASPRTLSRLFEKDLGMSFRRWRQLIRFHHAIDLLAQNNSVKQVAMKCGYRSPSAFSSAFQAYMGHTPSSIIDSTA